MKTRYFFFLLVIIIIVSCKLDNDSTLSTSELHVKIDNLRNQISEKLGMSIGASSDDCRTHFILGGNGCKPIYTYGIIGVDRLELEKLFDDLSQCQTELYNLEGGPACDIVLPTKDFLINQRCLACYGSKPELNCF